MRPVYLSIDGLACFKDKQDLDLSALERFAISGPTGAGKSTILDAMILALYGEVPRVSVKDRSEMIAASRDRLAVQLDFNVGPDRYRIVRALRRSGGHTVQLEKHDGHDFTITVADAVRPVEEAIVGLLGLDVTAFKQAVILPQGEFAEFLKADPKARRSMLRSLLRLDVYERMRIHSQQVATAKKLAIESARKVLEEEYRGVSEGALTDLEARVTKTGGQLGELRKRLDEAQRSASDLRALCAKTTELRKAELEREALQLQGAEIGRLRNRIDEASLAARLAPFLEEATRALQAAASASEIAERAKGAQVRADRAHKEQSALLEAAEKAAEAIPALRAQSARLHEVVVRLPEARRLEGTIARGDDQAKAAATDLANLAKAIAAARQLQDEQQAAAKVAEAALRKASYNPSLDELLESVRSRAVSLGGSRQAAQGSQRDLATKEESLGKLEVRIAALRTDATAARDAADKARQKVELAEAALHHTLRLDAANQLRTSLERGQLCPVCEQTVSSPPSAILNADVENARGALSAAKKGQREAETAARAAEDQLTTELASAHVAREHLAELSSHYALLIAGVARLEAEIRAALGDHVKGVGGTLEVWVESQAASLAAARKEHERAKQQLDTAEQALEKSRAEETSRRERLADKQAMLTELAKDLDADRQALAALRAQIAAVTQSSDPEAETAGLAKQIQALESTLKKASTSAAAAQSDQMKAQSESKLLIDAASKAREESTARVKRRDDEISRAGFPDEQAARDSLLDDTTTTTLTERIREYDHDLHAVDQRATALQAELGDVRVSNEQLAEAERLAKDLNKETERQYGEQKTLGEQVERMRVRIGRAKAMRDQLQEDELALRVHGQLASDLRSDKFQAYVLEEAFTELVNGASTRLLSLTEERYSLRFEDDNILVVDNDNGGETRISDTLSGGETFLTSLSLALELSDQVQRAAGAVNLDSLFIDEGFGTLDPDTLSLVSETIQSLQAGGRMVGIITHIPELRDEFAQQIIVTKHEGFSTVQVLETASQA